MTLEKFEMLWHLATWTALGGQAWFLWSRNGRPFFLGYPWYLVVGLVFTVKSGIEYAQGDIVWSVLTGLVAVFNLFMGIFYHDQKVDDDRERAGRFEKFRIDDK